MYADNYVVELIESIHGVSLTAKMIELTFSTDVERNQFARLGFLAIYFKGEENKPSLYHLLELCDLELLRYISQSLYIPFPLESSQEKILSKVQIGIIQNYCGEKLVFCREIEFTVLE